MAFEMTKMAGDDSGFNAAVPSPNRAVSSEAAVMREAQEVQAMMVVAKKFPRDEKAALERINNSCARPTLASKALYTYSRGGSEISGPSIRLAEAIAQHWGNLQYGWKEQEQRNGESTIQAYAWDMETNTRKETSFQVSHVRHTRQGSKKLEDPRDIYENNANQAARRVRACVLAVIPGDVVDSAVEACEATLKANVDLTPAKLKKMVELFNELGVSIEQLEVKVQRKLETISPAQYLNLGKIYNSIHDGMSRPEEWFTPANQQQYNTTVSNAEKQAFETASAKLDEALGKRKNAKPTSNHTAQPQESIEDKMASILKTINLPISVSVDEVKAENSKLTSPFEGEALIANTAAIVNKIANRKAQ